MTFTVMIDRDLRQAACKPSNQFETLILTPATTHSTHSNQWNTLTPLTSKLNISNPPIFSVHFVPTLLAEEVV